MVTTAEWLPFVGIVAGWGMNELGSMRRDRNARLVRTAEWSRDQRVEVYRRVCDFLVAGDRLVTAAGDGHDAYASELEAFASQGNDVRRLRADVDLFASSSVQVAFTLFAGWQQQLALCEHNLTMAERQAAEGVVLPPEAVEKVAQSGPGRVEVFEWSPRAADLLMEAMRKDLGTDPLGADGRIARAARSAVRVVRRQPKPRPRFFKIPGTGDFTSGSEPSAEDLGFDE